MIERRLGIPITLSVIYLEVGWRLGLPLVPVSFPAHFLVASTGAGRVFIDPFDRGARVAPAELVARLAPMAGGIAQARQILPRVTVPASRREVAMRILRNLRQIYSVRQDFERLLVVCNRMVALDPKDAAALRERGTYLPGSSASRPHITTTSTICVSRLLPRTRRTSACGSTSCGPSPRG